MSSRLLQPSLQKRCLACVPSSRSWVGRKWCCDRFLEGLRLDRVPRRRSEHFEHGCSGRRSFRFHALARFFLESPRLRTTATRETAFFSTSISFCTNPTTPPYTQAPPERPAGASSSRLTPWGSCHRSLKPEDKQQLRRRKKTLATSSHWPPNLNSDH